MAITAVRTPRLQLFEAKHLYRWDLEEKVRGQSLEQQKDLQPIIADCSTAIQLAPAVPDSYAVCGKARRYAGDVNAALANYAKLAELRPSDAEGPPSKWFDEDERAVTCMGPSLPSPRRLS